ncbi:MAG TPA: tol-pal system-associated acyl-CoA thioesterase [Nevskiaceae bacterium]|nr:tol-pal system-associated acyl-CoA thioesterase [Nevskiaceae bacterium]
MAEPFIWRVRVYYEDTDVSGVVYHAGYLRFLERARTEWLRALGQGQEQLRIDTGLAFTVANMEIDFLKPARLDDDLDVTVEVDQVRGASLKLNQTVLRRSDATLLTRARVRVGCVEAASFRPCPIPAGMFTKQTSEKAA